jgi:hypothetical protein
MTLPTITQALYFNEGYFLLAGDRPYFLPHGKDKAYACRGERKELLGKVHHRLETRAADLKNYDLTYEFEDGKLIAARLIAGRTRSVGRQLSVDVLQTINDDLATGQMTLQNILPEPTLIRAARFEDGEYLLVIDHYRDSEFRSVLKGKPGAYEVIELSGGVQGGNSLYFTAKSGEEIRLPYGFGGPNNESPSYGGRFLQYLDPRGNHTLASLGVPVKANPPHLDPFCPELRNGTNPCTKPPTPPGP